MSKIAIDEVESVLLQQKVDPSKVNQIVKDLEKIVEELTEERKANAEERQKWEYVIVLFNSMKVKTLEQLFLDWNLLPRCKTNWQNVRKVYYQVSVISLKD